MEQDQQDKAQARDAARAKAEVEVWAKAEVEDAAVGSPSVPAATASAQAAARPPLISAASRVIR